MEDWTDHLTQEELNYCSVSYGNHNFRVNTWNHGPNYETTSVRCLYCREVREVEETL